MALVGQIDTEFRPGYRPGQTEQTGRSTFNFEWDAQQVEQVVVIGIGRMMDKLAADTEAWLRANLHEYTGEMRAKSYAHNERTSQGFAVHAGSDTDHTFWHEVRYHPQLRQCMDLFAPTMGLRLREELGF